MNTTEAETLAFLHMEDHGLFDKKWTFSFHNKKCSLGTCSYRRKKIYLSQWFVELNNEDEVEDTILHEIAHALSYERYGSDGMGHGRLWKMVCREIGARPQRTCKSKLNRPQNHYKYVDTCACGITYKRHRLKSNVGYRCPKCYQNLFVKKKNIVVFRNGKKVLDAV